MLGVGEQLGAGRAGRGDPFGIVGEDLHFAIAVPGVRGRGLGQEVVVLCIGNGLGKPGRIRVTRLFEGWHAFWNSLIKALASKGVDHQLIDDMIGHQTYVQNHRFCTIAPT